VAHSCGHDRRGRPLVRDGRVDDEFPEVAAAYARRSFGSHLGFLVDERDLTPGYLVPRYYDPDLKRALERCAEQDDARLVSIGELVDQGALRISKGHEPGAEAYGTGTVPFIRTSDVANWEVSCDPTKSVSDEVYAAFAARQELRPFDVLFVNDGRYRIGQTCMLTEDSVRSVIQSHFRILRADEAQGLSPFLLLYLLKRPIIARQLASKVIIQSTIATLGDRLGELVIPIPRSPEVRRAISARVREIIEGRAALLGAARKIDMAFEQAAGEAVPGSPGAAVALLQP
jgi:type I restriction enzyme M protein